MVKDEKRFCDICAEEIPKGTVHRRSRLPAYAVALLTIDPDLTPDLDYQPRRHAFYRLLHHLRPIDGQRSGKE